MHFLGEFESDKTMESFVTMVSSIPADSRGIGYEE
jgi:hypothetical protein